MLLEGANPRPRAATGLTPGNGPKTGRYVLFDLLLEWAQDAAFRHRILVENPAILYDFPKSP